MGISPSAGKAPGLAPVFNGPAKPEGRTRVGNGRTLFLEGVDGRSTLAKRYREVFAQIISDLGGDPSEAQIQIARRAVALAVWAEGIEAKLAAGADLDVATYTTACNSLRRLLRDLGLERRAVDVNKTLGEYLASRAVPVWGEDGQTDDPAHDTGIEDRQPEPTEIGRGGQ